MKEQSYIVALATAILFMWSNTTSAAFYKFDWAVNGVTIHESLRISPDYTAPGGSMILERHLHVDEESLPIYDVNYLYNVPYLPDFEGITSWTPLRYIEDIFEDDFSLMDQVYFDGPIDPHNFLSYTEASYLWDYSDLGTWHPGFRIGDRFTLQSTPHARPGAYYIRFQLSFEIANLPTFEGIKAYRPERVLLKRKGTVTPRITITNTGSELIAAMAVQDDIFEGWSPPKNLKGVTVSVIDIDGAEWRLNHKDYSVDVNEDGQLEVVVEDFNDSAYGHYLEQGDALYIKYPMNFNRQDDVHSYSGGTYVTAINPTGGFTKSSFSTGLIINE